MSVEVTSLNSADNQARCVAIKLDWEKVAISPLQIASKKIPARAGICLWRFVSLQLSKALCVPVGTTKYKLNSR